MTNKEAIEVLKNDIEICTIQQEQACDMAIKALDQTRWLEELRQEHTCEGCISREKAIKIVLPYVDGDLIADELKHLSPVTPQPKIGKWIDCYKEMPIFNAGGFTETKHVGWTCSCCGENNFWIKSDYCPNCGAKMEDKE